MTDSDLIILAGKKTGRTVSLVTAGQFLRKANGEHFTAIECSDFNFINQVRSGNGRKILDQRAKIGFNTLRWFTAFYESAQLNGAGNPAPRLIPLEINNYYDKWLRDSVELCDEYGMYLDICAYTGWNDPDHWKRIGEVIKGKSNIACAELTNEYSINYQKPDEGGRVFNLKDYEPLEGILCSHGSNGSQEWPVQPYWNLGTIHFNDADQWWRKNGHNAVEVSPSVAMLTNESTRCNDRDSKESHYEDAAKGGALLCAGTCYHSIQGKMSNLLTGTQLVNAKAHVRGAKSINLDCQNYGYQHRPDLELDKWLRVYERGPYYAYIGF